MEDSIIDGNEGCLKWSVIVPVFMILIFVILGGIFFLNNGYDFDVQVIEESNVDVDQVLMKVMLKDSDTLVKELRVMNTGDSSEEVLVSSNMGDMVVFSEEFFSIEPGQTKVLQVGFRSYVEQTSVEYSNGIYVGEIVVASESIPVVVEVESEDVLFDMNINFPTGNIEAGDDVNVDVRLYNLMGTSAMSINVEYFVKDLKGNVLFSESETVVVDTQVSFTKSVSLPDNFASGTYVFGAEANYAGSTGTSSYLFDIDGEEEVVTGGFCPIGNPICLMIFGVFVLVAIFLVLILLYLFRGVFGSLFTNLFSRFTRHSLVYTMLIILLTLLVVLVVYVLTNGNFDVFYSVPVQIYVAVLVLIGVIVFIFVVHSLMSSVSKVSDVVKDKKALREAKLKDLERINRRKQIEAEKMRVAQEKLKLEKKKARKEFVKKVFGLVFLPFTLVKKGVIAVGTGYSNFLERRRNIRERNRLEKAKLKHLKEVQKHELELLKAKKDAEEKRRLAREEAKRQEAEEERRKALKEREERIFKFLTRPFRVFGQEAREKRRLAREEKDIAEKRRLAREERKRQKEAEERKVIEDVPVPEKKSLFHWFSKEAREERRLKRLEEKHEKEAFELKKKELALRTERKEKEKLLELERQSLMGGKSGRSFVRNVKQNVKGYMADRKHKAKQKELRKKFSANKLRSKISKEDKEISKLKKLLRKR